MALLRNIFWVVLFVIFTFLWVVLFQNGPSKFGESASKELAGFKEYMGMDKPAKKDAPPGTITPPK